MSRNPVPLFKPAILLILVALAGCARTSPFRQPVEAETPMALTLWRARMVHELTPDEWRWFDAVVQERKFQLMQAGKTTGAPALDETVRKALHGRPLAEIMHEGLQMLLRRKSAELADMNTALERNEGKRRFIKGNPDLLRDLEFHQAELRRKIARSEEEIAAAEASLKSFDAKAAR